MGIRIAVVGSDSNLTTIPKIHVRNIQRKVSVDVVELEKFAANALRQCVRLRRSQATELTKLRQISVLLVSDRRMAQLHRQFLNKSGPTDVLTFQHGEVFISVDTARRNARAFGTSLEHEARLYILHGLLHLHGFDDSTERDAREMERTQKRILERLA